MSLRAFTGEDFAVVGVFNWEEDLKAVEIVPETLGSGDCQEYSALCEGNPVSTNAGSLHLNLAPHSSQAYVFSRFK